MRSYVRSFIRSATSWRELTIGAAAAVPAFYRPRERAVAKRIVCAAFKAAGALGNCVKERTGIKKERKKVCR